MGIKGLSKLIADCAPGAISEKEIDAYFRRKVAIDASMSIYQFMIAIRTGPSADGAGGVLTNENGEVTSHLQGMFHRTIRMISNGIKPVYVFDGKPPMMKSGELTKRADRRDESNASLNQAKEEGNHFDVAKFSRRTVRVGTQENDDCKKLLQLMGIPIVNAPCEAEAQCSAMCKANLVYATATEDMDALTFGSPVLLRHMTMSAARKMKIQEFHVDDVLKGLDLTMEEFRDLCILCGCDYVGSIKGIGPKKALALIKKHHTLEDVIANIDQDKFKIPEDFDFESARALFDKPDIIDPKEITLHWQDPDEEGLIKYLVDEKGFNIDRVKAGLKTIAAAKKKGSQQRLEAFFGNPTVTKRKTASKETKNAATKKSKRTPRR